MSSREIRKAVEALEEAVGVIEHSELDSLDLTMARHQITLAGRYIDRLIKTAIQFEEKKKK